MANIIPQHNSFIHRKGILVNLVFLSAIVDLWMESFSYLINAKSGNLVGSNSQSLVTQCRPSRAGLLHGPSFLPLPSTQSAIYLQKTVCKRQIQTQLHALAQHSPVHVHTDKLGTSIFISAWATTFFYFGPLLLVFCQMAVNTIAIGAPSPNRKLLGMFWNLFLCCVRLGFIALSDIDRATDCSKSGWWWNDDKIDCTAAGMLECWCCVDDWSVFHRHR